MNTKQQRSIDTGLAANLILLICFVFTRQAVFIYMAIGISVLVMTIPRAFYHPSIVWFYLTHKLGLVASFVIMNIVFTCLVIPVGIVRRLIGKDNLNIHGFQNADNSNFHERSHRYTSHDLENTY